MKFGLEKKLGRVARAHDGQIHCANDFDSVLENEPAFNVELDIVLGDFRIVNDSGDEVASAGFPDDRHARVIIVSPMFQISALHLHLAGL